MEELKVRKKERRYNGWLKVNSVEIELPNKKVITREVVEKKDVVAIVALTDEGDVFLTTQPRAGAKKLNSIEIPAGLIEEKHSFDPLIAAKAELEEETGSNPEECEWIYLGTFIGDPACVESTTHLYLAKHAKQCKALKLDPDEYLESFKMNYHEALKIAKDPFDERIEDANSVIGLTRAETYILK